MIPANADPTEFWITLAIFAASAVIIGLMAWLERRPRTDFSPRLIPTTPILLVFGFVGLLALVHLLNLWGIHTGRGM
jgi:hypothetical protein